MKKDSGFSLIELSVVMLIIGLLLVTSFEGSKYFLIQNNIKATNVKLNAIQRAIEIYVRRTGHLPCPAPLAKTSGSSNVENCNTLSNNGNDGIYKKDQILVGGVPYRDLDLTADLSHDAWGGKFVYSIYVPAGKNIRELQDNDDYLEIYENAKDENKNNLITNNAVYSLVSAGRNKYGAFDFNTNTQLDWGRMKGKVEQKNGPDNDKKVIIYFSDQTKGDDIVRYKTKTQLIVDTELEDLNCCINNDIIDGLRDSLGITETITFKGNESFGTTKCNMLYNAEINGTSSSGSKYKLKCFKYGRLGILKIN